MILPLIAKIYNWPAPLDCFKPDDVEAEENAHFDEEAVMLYNL
jgi:hypothetical protein